MFFDGFEQHNIRNINPALLWEYDLSTFDFQALRPIVVQRVVERGWLNDWHAILNIYGIEGVKEAIKTLPYLNEKDMHFVSLVFNIPINEMKCFEKKQSMPAYWNS